MSGDSPPPANVGVFVRASPEEVWRLVGDIVRMPEWRPHLEGLHWIDEPERVSSRFAGESTFAIWRNIRLVCRVTVWDPPFRFGYEVVEGPIRADAHWVIEPRDDGSYLYSAGDIVGNSSSTKLLRPLARPMYMRVVRKELEQLKRLAESDP